MLRRSGFVLMLLALAMVLNRGVQAAETRNVLLICVDDLKPSFGAYGDKWVVSPSLDRLASMGMTFEKAYCNQAVCAPSRNHLLVGQRSTTLGIYDLGTNFRRSLPSAVTLPQHFKNHGYHVTGAGKIFHIGHGNVGDERSWSEPFQKESVVEYLLPESRHGAEMTKEEALFSNKPAKGLARGAAWEIAEVADDQYADGRTARYGAKRLADYAKSDKPFFLALGFAKPHLPYCAPKTYWDLYDPSKLPLATMTAFPEGAPRYADKGLIEIDQYTPVPNRKPFTEELQRELLHGYYASLSYMDAQLGLVLDALKETGLDEKTVVVLWGDHGYHLGDHGMWTKHTNYEQANRIPLLISAPGVAQPGTRSASVVETVDIYPTLCELAGLPVDENQPLEGTSLVPLLKDPKLDLDDYAYHAYPRGERMGRAIRTSRYRMVEWKPIGGSEDQAEFELYDYQNDPGEALNLASKQPEVLESLKKILGRQPEAKRPVR
ncbi:sulfatase [Lacunimicrobium album]